MNVIRRSICRQQHGLMFPQNAADIRKQFSFNFGQDQFPSIFGRKDNVDVDFDQCLCHFDKFDAFSIAPVFPSLPQVETTNGY